MPPSNPDLETGCAHGPLHTRPLEMHRCHTRIHTLSLTRRTVYTRGLCARTAHVHHTHRTLQTHARAPHTCTRHRRAHTDVHAYPPHVCTILHTPTHHLVLLGGCWSGPGQHDLSTGPGDCPPAESSSVLQALGPQELESLHNRGCGASRGPPQLCTYLEGPLCWPGFLSPKLGPLSLWAGGSRPPRCPLLLTARPPASPPEAVSAVRHVPRVRQQLAERN